METKNSDTCAKLRSLPPATKLGQGCIFTGVCDSVNGGGRAWLLLGGGMHGFFRGGTVCVVFTGGGSVHGFCQGGVHGFFLGGGRAWFFWGGVRRIRRDMVNERAVRILLECILVTVVNLPQFS